MDYSDLCNIYDLAGRTKSIAGETPRSVVFHQDDWRSIVIDMRRRFCPVSLDVVQMRGLPVVTRSDVKRGQVKISHVVEEHVS